MHIHFINGKCHIKQLKCGKNYKTCLTNHIWYMSHLITPLVINGIGADTDRQTDRQAHKRTDMQTKKIQETRHTLATGQHAPDLKI